LVSLGLRQRLNEQWTLLGTVEWTNWSRIGTSNVNNSNTGAFLEALPFQFKDGWLYAVGAEYKWNDRLTLRSGIAYENSPVTDQVRMPVVPDSDRFWLSVGATYIVTSKLAFDFAYSHVWVRDASINISGPSGNPWFNPAVPVSYVGSVDGHIDHLSIGLKYRWDDPVVPVKQAFHK
jgi:long-chain fatty acid transport protein